MLINYSYFRLTKKSFRKIYYVTFKCYTFMQFINVYLLGKNNVFLHHLTPISKPCCFKINMKLENQGCHSNITSIPFRHSPTLFHLLLVCSIWDSFISSTADLPNCRWSEMSLPGKCLFIKRTSVSVIKCRTHHTSHTLKKWDRAAASPSPTLNSYIHCAINDTLMHASIPTWPEPHSINARCLGCQ